MLKHPNVGDYARYGWRLLNGAGVEHERAFARMRWTDIAPLLGAKRPLKVLDLANGRLRPQYTLLKADGHRVHGIDLVNRPRRTWTDMAYRGVRTVYRWKLGVPAEGADAHTLVCGNVTALPFPDEEFDLVTSIAAFEHFLDVEVVMAELRRVVRPGGVVWACIHLFTSPSGGHNLRFAEVPLRTIPAAVGPWDHLRHRRLPFHVPLNEWRMGQYRDAFASHFELVKDYCAIREGDEFLSPAIEAELAGFSREELTCRAYVCVARKP